MQFKMIATAKYRLNKKLEWHPWFAWFPVLINESDDYSKRYAFMEVVARKGIKDIFNDTWVGRWQYKAVEDMT